MREGPSILELRRHVDLLSRGVPPNIPRIEVRDLRSGANFQSRFWVRFESTGTSVARWRVSARDLHNSVMYILGSSDNLLLNDAGAEPLGDEETREFSEDHGGPNQSEYRGREQACEHQNHEKLKNLNRNLSGETPPSRCEGSID